MSVIEVKHIDKAYQDIDVFKDFSMSVEENHFTVIKGESGSGKSTLLNMIGLLDKADKGSIVILGKEVKPYTRAARALLRDEIGYLFQNFALLEQESVSYNLKIANAKASTSEMEEVMKTVGLAPAFLKKKVCQCSGGEQQRIAIARLLLKPCKLVLADEPTGSLDHKNRNQIYELLKTLQRQGKTIVVVSHDEDLIQLADDVIELRK